jgi:peptide/nickel transport system substrate-binding protein
MISYTRKAFIFALVATLITGCSLSGARDETSPVEEGGTLVRAMTSEPSQIDPQGTPSSGLSLVLPYLFDTLVVRDLDNSVQPLLARDWQVSEDGKEITFYLKEGVTFHDGTPLDAEAVRFTFERFKEVGKRSPIYGGVQQIAGIEVIDDLTVRFTFEQPNPNFWGTISMPYAGIISPASVAEVEESGEGYILGSGPFILDSWKSGQSITMTRNPDYTWGPPVVKNQGPPHLDAFVYKVIPDAATQLAALKSGDVDVMFINQPSHRMELEDHESIQLKEALMNGLIYLGFNCQEPPFEEVLVRQALSLAVNKEEIVELALGGMGEVAFAPLPPTLPGFDPSLKDHELSYDPQEAQSLLSEAGFERNDAGKWERDGQIILTGVLLTSTRAPNGEIAAVIQSHLDAIGVEIEIQQLESRAVMQATGEGQFDLLLWRYGWSGPDALNIFLSSDRIGSTNRVAYSNPEVDSLLEQADHELDDETRLNLYVETQQNILQDAPWQPLYNPVSILAIRDRVEGTKLGYMGRLLLNDVRIVNEIEK